ncbi:site-specific integrase [Dyella sp.]|uniref:site-specific integrase n=1 Tax=Dyella sp. TaxID=1869338 RepID=UPI002D7833B1|nr:site-specific integrase [Dyella sp.]HET7332903.1 site-specific integrase [Dyella sp.]
MRTSKDGYRFDAASSRWKLNKDVTVYLEFASDLSGVMQRGFRKTLQRYAEEMSARHTENMAKRFQRFLSDTNANSISSASLLNWRGMLGEAEQCLLGGLKGFLLAWYDYGYEGISDEVADLLRGWRIKGNAKGEAVIAACPETGPLTDLELSALLSWANTAVVRRLIPFWIYAYFLTLAMTARRSVQVAALRGKDLQQEGGDNQLLFRVNFPRAKQRGGRFRETFRSLAVPEDLYNVLICQHQQSVGQIGAKLRRSLPTALCMEVPIFLNPSALCFVKGLASIERLLRGSTPDFLHATTGHLTEGLRSFAKLSTARSERTGEYIRISATRFRYTRGTKLRREGFGAFIIAELLDHSDIQNVQVYMQNTASEAVAINELVGAELAPFAQACMGTLVWSEREAVRGDDRRSRVPNHRQNGVGTCGNYGFCASGYRACYTCCHFQPWVNGPHEEVLEELYEEKRRVRAAGCSDEVVNANDQLILAVEHCVQLCEDARSSGGVGATYSEDD